MSDTEPTVQEDIEGIEAAVEELMACAHGQPLRGNTVEATCEVIAMYLQGLAQRLKTVSVS